MPAGGGETIRAVLRFTLATLLASAATAALAQSFPEKPIRFVVGFTPGGPSDILARALGQKLAERWSQKVVIENRPGAGGNVAAEAVARSGPDGYTWLLGNNSILATNQTLYRSLPYDPIKDFAPVSLVAVQPNILVVNPQVPANSVAELIALAKKNPGKLNYASSGAGAAAHLAGELFKTMAGVDLVHVPYKGAQPALTDVIAGQVQVMFATSASVIPFIKAGKLRGLAVTSARRSPSVPDLPTVSEAGVAGFEAITWHGVVVPAATPAPLVERLNRDIVSVLGQPDRQLAHVLAPADVVPDQHRAVAPALGIGAVEVQDVDHTPHSGADQRSGLAAGQPIVEARHRQLRSGRVRRTGRAARRQPSSVRTCSSKWKP